MTWLYRRIIPDSALRWGTLTRPGPVAFWLACQRITGTLAPIVASPFIRSVEQMMKAAMDKQLAALTEAAQPKEPTDG